MRLITVIPLVFIISMHLLAGVSCARENTQSSTPEQLIKDINPKQAFELIQKNVNNLDFVIIDVRTAEEFNNGHIENAKNVDVNSGNFKEDISQLDRSKKYLIYCRTGIRGKAASTIMQEQGFREIYNIEQGITGWMDAGYPIVK